MKRKGLLALLLAATLCLTATFPGTITFAQGKTDSFITAQKALLDEPAMEYRPATRWWLAEGLHTDQTIVDGVQELYDMGIGGIEIVCRSGGARLPEDLDENLWPEGTTAANIYSWGSEEWIHDTELIIQEATKYGMSFSLTSGTNWSNANLPEKYLVPDDDGAGKSLGYAIQTVSAGEPFSGVLARSAKSGDGVNRQDLVAVVAMKRDPSSDGTIDTNTGNLVFNASDPAASMVYDDSATQILTNEVKLNGVPVTGETMKDPTGEAQFTLDWTPADDGVYDIYSFWIQATGQSATPSATKNYTINYVDPFGMEEFLKYYDDVFFTPELKEIIRQNGKGEVYMDSLEISTTNGQTGQFWGYTLLDEFKTRHGYDLTPYLPFIIRTGARWEYTAYLTKMLDSDGVTEEKIRTDLYSTLTDLYVENVLSPLKNYLNTEMNMKLRAEIAYNLPYELSQSALGVDYVETESLDMGEQIESFRGFAGAANLYGRRLSSESGALYAQNYVHGAARYLKLFNTQFASGVQHTVLHGYSSISGPDPADDGDWTTVYWPGGEVMGAGFSERWGSRQPAAVHYDGLMTYIARNQAVLQQGKAQVDLAIMRTDYYNVHDYNGGVTDTDTMRNRKALFMKDLSLQDAGYTYNYFAPENLERLGEEGIADYRAGEGLIPDNAGYQAIIVYEDSINVESAQKLLDLAKRGMPVIIVNGLTARYMLTSGATNWGGAVGSSFPKAETDPALVAVSKTYEKAAVYTLGNDGRDGELAEIMKEIKAISNVVEVSPEDLPDNPVNPDPEAWGYDDEYFYGKTGILEALQSLGIRPRAEYSEANQNYLTAMRKTDDTLYLFVYNFMAEDEFKAHTVDVNINNTVNLSVNGTGKPYMIDAWTGEIEAMGHYVTADGRTSFDVTLEPGATTVIAIDLSNQKNGLHAISTNANKVLDEDGALTVFAENTGTYTTGLSDGTEVTSEIKVPAKISLPEWNLTVEDWSKGEKELITENRGLGYSTTEALWTTKKTCIEVGKTPLISWSEIPEVGPDVSGIGRYSATFELPADWSDANGAYLQIESLCGNTAAVTVNGQKASALDILSRTVDISELLQPGKNTIEVEVSTTLRNRLIQMGYKDMTGGFSMANRTSITYEPADYGMIGDVAIVPYTKAVISTGPVDPESSEPGTSESESSGSVSEGSGTTPPDTGVPASSFGGLVMVAATSGLAVLMLRKKKSQA